MAEVNAGLQQFLRRYRDQEAPPFRTLRDIIAIARRISLGTCVGRPDQRLENWNRLRAPGCPYFLRSTLRESRVRNPACFSLGRNSGL